MAVLGTEPQNIWGDFNFDGLLRKTLFQFQNVVTPHTILTAALTFTYVASFYKIRICFEEVIVFNFVKSRNLDLLKKLCISIIKVIWLSTFCKSKMKKLNRGGEKNTHVPENFQAILFYAISNIINNNRRHLRKRK